MESNEYHLQSLILPSLVLPSYIGHLSRSGHLKSSLDPENHQIALDE